MSREALTTIVFPLQTSVELFRDPEAPTAHARAKHAAVLYERLIFEEGIYEMTFIDGGGSNAFWRPATDATNEELRDARVLHETGTPFQLSMGVQSARGVPAPPEKMRVMMQGPVSRHYVAEWESLLRELAPLKPDWVETFVCPDHALPQLMRDELRDLNWEASRDQQLLPGADTFLRDFTFQAFNRDALAASRLGGVFNITSLFTPMLTTAGVSLDSPGDRALEIWVPGLGGLPWEAILEFRQHPGAAEARHRLRELEREAGQGEIGRLKVAQHVTDDLIAAVEDMKPRFGIETVRQVLQTGVGILVPAAAPLSSLMEAGVKSRRHRRSWRAALMRLRQRSSERF